MNNEWADEMNSLYQNIIETETQLAQLHADVYQYRDEIRTIRVSFPEQFFKNNIRTIKPSDMEKMKRKKVKIEKSLEKLHKKINKKYQVVNRKNKQDNNNIFLTILLIIMLSGFMFMLFGKRENYFSSIQH